MPFINKQKPEKEKKKKKTNIIITKCLMNSGVQVIVETFLKTFSITHFEMKYTFVFVLSIMR